MLSGTTNRKQKTGKRGQKKCNDEAQHVVKQSRKSAKALHKKAELDASNAAAKQIFQKTDVQALQAQIEELKKQLTKAKDASDVWKTMYLSKVIYCATGYLS